MKLFREVKASEGKYILRPVDPENVESVLTFVEPIEITEEEIKTLFHILADEYCHKKTLHEGWETDFKNRKAHNELNRQLRKAAKVILSKLKGDEAQTE